MRLLVTGGAGFIGSHFVRTAVSEELGQVRVLDKLTYAGNLANLRPVANQIEVLVGDICDPQTVAAAMVGVDQVVHFAAESHVDRSITSAAEFVRTNVAGTQVLLDAARDANVGTFLQVSTDEVYGSITNGSWPETDPLDPNSPYAASKASADLLALAYHRTYDMDVRITRCSNNYGPYQNIEKLVPLFTTRLLDSRSVPLYGDGQNIRDWLHVDDHCRGLRLVLEHGQPGQIYNLGGNTELTNKELTSRILEALGHGWDLVRYVTDRPAHDRRYSVDWTKAAEQLGYHPTISFEQGLGDTIDWYRQNRSWWSEQLPAVRS